MERRKLGESDLQISRLGCGTWAIGGGGWQYAWGAQDDGDSVGMLHAAWDRGINWIDTAPAYGTGHSEEVVGQAVRSWSGERPLLFTKCGLTWNERRELGRDLSPARLRVECEASLRRLRVDCIDLYQIHWPTEDPTEAEAAWGELARLREAGKIRWAGVSNFEVPLLERLQRIMPVVSLQPPYSLVRRGIEAEILPYCALHNIGTLVYSPLESGLLTGAMTRERLMRMPWDDWRRTHPFFQEPAFSRHLELVDRLRSAGASRGLSPASLAVAWVLRQPAVTAAIIGARHPDQLEALLAARLVPAAVWGDGPW
ncbi:aldo/keto reductase [Actomonas aquatica]|uniref:Aldo/keto reductase n=1 Tax=Actomonas aquatica TaxID=2866162 RepID=A0ABZ1C3M6_9BACT|nr:aldo/keto reductase [Opitutus sp. WL0086]WRQ85823.1 aldo/keto reductase [Opitutus sp. WL0086]